MIGYSSTFFIFGTLQFLELGFREFLFRMSQGMLHGNTVISHFGNVDRKCTFCKINRIRELTRTRDVVDKKEFLMGKLANSMEGTALYQLINFFLRYKIWNYKLAGILPKTGTIAHETEQFINPASTEKIFFKFSSDFSVCFPLRPLDMGSERKKFLSLPEV